MLKHLLAAILALFAMTAFAAVDVNKATLADLEWVSGLGPAIAGTILDERKKGSFKDWDDLIERVKGIGEGNATKLSAGGLTVGGAIYKGGAPAAKKDDKPAATANKGDRKTDAAAGAKKDEKRAEPKADATKGENQAAAKPEDAASKPAAKK